MEETVIVIAEFDSNIKARKAREIIAGMVKAKYYPEGDYYAYQENSKEWKLKVRHNKSYAKPTYELILE